MATKQTDLNNPTGAADLSNAVAEPSVQPEPKQSFEERTKSATPWLDEDGNQVNGSDDVEVGDQEPQIVDPEAPVETPEEVPAEEPEKENLVSKVKNKFKNKKRK